MSETTTATRARFTLDEDAARAWLARGIAQYEGEIPEGQEYDRSLPEIEADWFPGQDDSGATVSNLLSAARHAGIMACPDDSAPEYEFDSAGEGYRWLLFTGPEHHQLILAGSFNCTWSEEEGADAALTLLREAVAEANQLLDDLESYVASATAEPDDITCGQADETGEDQGQ